MYDRSGHGSVLFCGVICRPTTTNGESFDVYPADKCIGENCFPSETPSMSEKFSFNAFVVQKQSVVIARSSGLSGGEIAYRLREEEAAEEYENAAYKSEFLQF